MKRRRYLTFSLRTLFILLTALAVWLGVVVNRAREQREAVKAIEALGGKVAYDWQATRLIGFRYTPRARKSAASSRLSQYLLPKSSLVSRQLATKSKTGAGSNLDSGC